MVNDVMRDSIEWAFSIFSQIWPIVVFPSILFFTVHCFKTLCGLSCRRSVPKKSTPAKSALAADSVPVSVPDPVPVPASDRLYICSGCDDCPMLLKGDKCRLSGTAFCSIGKWVSKGGKLI